MKFFWAIIWNESTYYVTLLLMYLLFEFYPFLVFIYLFFPKIKLTIPHLVIVVSIVAHSWKTLFIVTKCYYSVSQLFVRVHCSLSKDCTKSVHISFSCKYRYRERSIKKCPVMLRVSDQLDRSDLSTKNTHESQIRSNYNDTSTFSVTRKSWNLPLPVDMTYGFRW